MLVKLYKQDGDRRFYWEAWDSDGTAVFHTGELGQRGSTERCTLDSQSVEALIESKAEAARREGFQTVPRSAMQQVILSCSTKPGWVAQEMLDVASYLEDLCNDCLGWTGLGHCDGPSYGRDEVSVYSLVVDLELGIQAIVGALRRNGCEGKDEEIVLSVPDGATFRVVYTTGRR
jgi:hypothetical protein